MTNTTLQIRRARKEDLPRIVQMLADDYIGAQREVFTEPLLANYVAAFNAIDTSENNELIVACIDDEVIGTLQVTYIPGLSCQGSWRALIEGVRIDARFHSRGYGKSLINAAIEMARERGCRIVQLTKHKSRTRAIRFYESLGFVTLEDGMKLQLT